MSLKKIVLYTSLIFLVIFAYFGIKIYRIVFTPNTSFEESKVYVYIPTGSNFNDLKEILAPYVANWNSFEAMAEQRKYNYGVRSGRFQLQKGMNNHALIQTLTRNLPVRVTFNNQERLENFAGRIATQIEPDSISLLEAFKEPKFLEENEQTEESVLSMFMPNTFEFYWNTTARQFRDRVAKEYYRFWNEERTAKAEKINLTPIQIVTLASIVQKESTKVEERPRVAGVYLNRLKKGMPLQADPTVIYAYKLVTDDFDQVIKRVLYRHLETDSPYNTYKYAGLPPGPIFMPDVSSIEAVLNAEQHHYIYFCASIERFGYHEFATTLDQHNVNRRKYVQWLNQQ